MLRRVTLHQLRLMASLARHMNMTRAAEEMHMTASAFSVQIKQFSESLGLPLHEQAGKKLFLTEAGRAAAPRAGRCSNGWSCWAWSWPKCRGSSAAACGWR